MPTWGIFPTFGERCEECEEAEQVQNGSQDDKTLGVENVKATEAALHLLGPGNLVM